MWRVSLSSRCESLERLEKEMERVENGLDAFLLTYESKYVIYVLFLIFFAQFNMRRSKGYNYHPQRSLCHYSKAFWYEIFLFLLLFVGIFFSSWANLKYHFADNKTNALWCGMCWYGIQKRKKNENNCLPAPVYEIVRKYSIKEWKQVKKRSKRIKKMMLMIIMPSAFASHSHAK